MDSKPLMPQPPVAAPAAAGTPPMPKPAAVVKPQNLVPPKPAGVAKPKFVKVVATRAGFYDLCRKKPGDVFSIPADAKIGEWMRYEDPKLEAERQAARAKLEKTKKAGK